MNYYLASIEPFLIWGGLAIYLLSLGLYGARTNDWKAILRFWEPLLTFTPKEFKVNRTGLSLMILAVVVRVYLNFFA